MLFCSVHHELENVFRAVLDVPAAGCLAVCVHSPHMTQQISVDSYISIIVSCVQQRSSQVQLQRAPIVGLLARRYLLRYSSTYYF